MAADDLKTYFEFSDDEEAEEDAETAVMTFGKHRGKTLKYIVSFSTETREYSKFLLTLSDLDHTLRTNISTLLARADLLPPVADFQTACLTILKFGQFSGSSLEDLVKYHNTRVYLHNLLKWEGLSCVLREHINVVLGQYHKLKTQIQ
jgi:hypothetical protein